LFPATDRPGQGRRWDTRCLTTAVLLISGDGTKEFVRDSHVHGVRDGRLLLARGRPGAGLDARVIREVELTALSYAETVTQETYGPGQGNFMPTRHP
jgi:hypothetical protein